MMIYGGKGLEIMGFFSVCEGKGNKQNSKLSFSNIRTSDCLNLSALTEFFSHDNLTTSWDYINYIH